MKTLEQMAEELVQEFASQIPGSFDHTEGVKCCLAGLRAGLETAEEIANNVGRHSTGFRGIDANCSQIAAEIRALLPKEGR